MKVKVVIVGLGKIAGLLENDKLREKPCTPCVRVQRK